MKLEYCADAAALYQSKLVLVERLSYPLGYALPGGRRDQIDGKLEEPATCAIREFEEETGLVLIIEGEVGIYDTPRRDPRGPKISTVIYGYASGEIRNEPNKTRVILVDPLEVDQYQNMFAFDHYQIIKDWQKLINKNNISKVDG